MDGARLGTIHVILLNFFLIYRLITTVVLLKGTNSRNKLKSITHQRRVFIRTQLQANTYQRQYNFFLFEFLLNFKKKKKKVSFYFFLDLFDLKDSSKLAFGCI